MFDPIFMQNVENVLTEKCSPGVSVSRTDVTKALNLSPDYNDVIGLIVKKKMLPKFEAWRGRGGGIGLAGTRTKAAAKPKGERGPSAKPYPDGFLQKLRDTLSEVCEPGANSGVTREAIASAMGIPGSPTEFLISQAIRLKDVEGYRSQVGRNGGIYAMSPSQTTVSNDTMDSDNSTDSTDSIESDDSSDMDE